MDNVADFILELGVEELPIYDQEDLVEQLKLNLLLQLTEHKLTTANTQVFSAPRRLAVIIEKLSLLSAPFVINKRGMLVNPNDNTNAQAFAKSLNVTIDDLQTMQTPKGTYWCFEQHIPGNNAIELLPAIIHAAVDKLNVKKKMRWHNQSKGFVRPVLWVLAKLGTQVIDVNLFNIPAGNYTYGHRFHSNQPLLINTASEYEQILLQHQVIANKQLRLAAISQQLSAIASEHNAQVVWNEDLLTIVTNLTEFPVAMCASFNPEFLSVPKECLISAMEQHQKCFALIDKHGQLLPKFLLISNIKSINPQVIIHGNELVMNARLHDAAFHFNVDKQHRLSSRIDKLREIAFEQKLGSLFDKIARIQIIATQIASDLQLNTSMIEQSSLLCKADLTTNMVNEFPELQGIMGKYYAQIDQVDPLICQAIEEHYWPKHAKDTLSDNLLAICIGLADRLDTVAGLFSVGKAPTGEKDPYGLRRQALAIMRTIVEKKLPLDLAQLFTLTLNNFQHLSGDNTQLIASLVAFCFERLKSLVIKEQFASLNEFNAIEPQSKPYDFILRLHAVVNFKNLEQAASLASANKRVKNMLSKSESSLLHEISPKLLTTNEEQQLYQQFINIEKKIQPLLAQQDYTQTLVVLAEFKTYIDNFFDNVLINVIDVQIKNNRLALLKKVRDLFLQVADISVL
jgi:glycyl-tRNA synthetase beta chain